MEPREFEVSRKVRVIAKEDGTVVFSVNTMGSRWVPDSENPRRMVNHTNAVAGFGRVDLRFDRNTTSVADLEAAERKATQQADEDFYSQLRMILGSDKP